MLAPVAVWHYQFARSFEWGEERTGVSLKSQQQNWNFSVVHAIKLRIISLHLTIKRQLLRPFVASTATGFAWSRSSYFGTVAASLLPYKGKFSENFFLVGMTIFLLKSIFYKKILRKSGRLLNLHVIPLHKTLCRGISCKFSGLTLFEVLSYKKWALNGLNIFMSFFCLQMDKSYPTLKRISNCYRSMK